MLFCEMEDGWNTSDDEAINSEDELRLLEVAVTEDTKETKCTHHYKKMLLVIFLTALCVLSVGYIGLFVELVT